MAACAHAEKPGILVVKDGKGSPGKIGAALESAGCRLYLASPGQDALLKYQPARTGLIMLKLNSPDTNGADIVRRLRKWASVPIVVISVRERESETIGRLEAGAGDCLTRPVCSRRLVARVRAALRRTFEDDRCEAFTGGRLRVEFGRREVFVGGVPIGLTATEYHLLNVFIRHAGRVTGSNLRRKLASDSGYESPRGYGTRSGIPASSRFLGPVFRFFRLGVADLFAW